jgi:hypothetical protein
MQEAQSFKRHRSELPSGRQAEVGISGEEFLILQRLTVVFRTKSGFLGNTNYRRLDYLGC